MMENDNFTEGAKDFFFRYLQELRASLYESGLSKDEVEESIEDIYQHILSNCTFRAGPGSIITKDIVSKSLHKLGDPDIIQRTLAAELNFLERNKELISETNKPNMDLGNSQSEMKYIYIRGKHLAMIYNLLHIPLVIAMVDFFFKIDFFSIYYEPTAVVNAARWTYTIYLTILIYRYIIVNLIIKSASNSYILTHLKFKSIIYFFLPLLFYMGKPIYELTDIELQFIAASVLSFILPDGRKWIHDKLKGIKYVLLLLRDLGSRIIGRSPNI